MKLDHWLWCSNGLHGINSMMERLEKEGVAPSAEAVQHMKTQLARFMAVVDKAQAKQESTTPGDRP